MQAKKKEQCKRQKANQLLAFDFCSIERVLIRTLSWENIKHDHFVVLINNESPLHKCQRRCRRRRRRTRLTPTFIHSFIDALTAQSNPIQTNVEQQFPNLITQFIESNKTLNNCFYAVASTTHQLRSKNKRKSTIPVCRFVFYVVA